MNGTKTFNTVPIVGTRGTGDSTTFAASTAFVKNQNYVTSSGVTSIVTGVGLTGGTITATGTVAVDYGVSGLIADCPGGTGSISENDFIMIGRDDSASGETRTYEVQEILSLGTQGTVTAVQVSNPTTTAGSNQPLQLSGTAAVPIINFHRLAVADLPNLVTTETSAGVGGGVINGTWNANTQLDKTSAVDSNYQGEIVYFGSYPAGVSGAAGKIYVYTTPDGIWKPVQANDVSTTAGLLAISLGTATSNGLLTRGTYTLSYTTVGSSEGSVLYIESASAGQVTHEPPSGTGKFVRIVATQLDGANGQIFFHPDNTFIEL